MKLLVADDHDLFREMLKSFLEAEGEFAVTLAGDVAAAIRAIETTGGFDLVLLDFTMPGMNGFDGFEAVKRAAGDARVALMSGTASPDIARRALSQGAIGFLPKTLPAASLANAVRLMAGGEVYVPLSIALAEAAPASANPLAALLTARELEVLAGLCQGKANKEIARDLSLREPTIKLHVKSLCRKMDARNRTHAAMIAKDSGAF